MIDSIIRNEEGILGQMMELRDRSSLSNIIMFLDAFIQSRENTIRFLRGIESGEEHRGEIRREIKEIGSTEHLAMGDVDPNSLRDTLLFISKLEEESLRGISEAVGKVSDPGLRRLLEGMLSDRRKVKAKAEHLYHDLIETSY
ncbi:hypothetical protein GCM10007108_04290 [Thermogymnomonas acidicola]|uniref:DUF2383 domain-containing protein n=1 Tax=Thermogymnomonas acidicola TaxID=399579 RepID=A0AA37BQ82_9ARCH|nr:hypothetical protein GCM10007108_04290 [Thermogymnomonas acidicola]